jgi:hypothetical protein
MTAYDVLPVKFSQMIDTMMDGGELLLGMHDLTGSKVRRCARVLRPAPRLMTCGCAAALGTDVAVGGGSV